MSNISVTTTQSVITVTQTGGITVTTPEGQTINVEVPNSSVNVTNTTDDITITEVGITNTDQLIEGTTNLFFTNARARSAISLTSDDTSILNYNSSTGVFTWNTPTTTKINEGTNLYYTTARANTDFDTRLATKTTTNLAEGTNLYYTTARANTDFDTRLATKSTTNLAEGTNQYFTTARARQSLSAGTGISYDNVTGVITNTSINTDTTYTIDATTATGGANLNLVGSDATTDTVKIASGTNITVSRTDANTITIDGSDLNTTYTISSASTTGGANLTLTGSDSSTDSVAYLGSGATTVTRTDANTITVSSTDTNTTYTQNFSSTSGGTNLNLVGSDATTDTVKFADGTGVTITRTDADTATIAIGQPVGTGDSVQFNNITLTGNIIDTGALQISTGANGNITLAPNGTGIVMANAGVQSTKSFAAGNATIGSSGEIGAPAAFDATGAASGSTMQLGLRSENVTAGFAVTNSIIDHGQNRPSGGATTSGNPNLFMESTRGTAAAPTATGSGDNIGSLSLAGHDGVRGLGSQVNGGSVQLIALAGQAFANSGGFTTQAGATTILRSQPNNLRLTSASRQNLFLASYTGGTTNTPPTQNLVFNSASMATQYDTAGNTINGHGRQDVSFYHPTISIFGVPAESTANADNSTLPGSNVLTFFSSRQSGWSGRRDIVQNGDTLAQIRVFGQTTDNSTGTGSQTGTIEFDAAELFSATRRGSVFKIQTGEIGTNTLSNRLSLDSDNTTFSTTKTRFATPGVANYGGEISQKVGILNGSTSYDKTTELSVTALTIDGTSNATYETKTLRSTDGVNYTPTQNNDVLGRFTFLGNYATGTAPLVSNAAGNISVKATEAWTAGASGAAMQFNVNKTGTNTNISVLDLAAAASTFRSDSFTLQNSSSTNIAGGLINYRRTHGCFHKVANVTAAAANTVYEFDWYTDTTVHVGNQGVTVTAGNPTRVNIDTAGRYTAFMEMQVKNTVSANRVAWIWLAKNGTDLSETRIKAEIKQGGGTDAYQLISKLWLLENIAANDYIEVRFAVDNISGISLEYEAAQASPFAMPAQPSATLTIVPVGA
jgi:hypothetical protein